MGVGCVAGSSLLQEPIAHCHAAPPVQFEEWPARRPKGMVPQRCRGCGSGRRPPGGFKTAKGRNTVLSLRRVRVNARKSKLKHALGCRHRRRQKARQRQREVQRHRRVEALREAISRVRKWTKGEKQRVHALAFAMWLHKSPPEREAKVTAPPSPGPMRGVAESQAPVAQRYGTWAWVRWTAREVWKHMETGYGMLVACTPCRTWGFNVRRWIAWVSGEAYKPGPGTPTPGKFMRIRTFYYLPPKAGFNWRGPARR